jgi:hypothetical protein
MIRMFNGQRIFVCVVSSNRPENVKPMMEKVGMVTWIVPPAQRHLYKDASRLGEGSSRNVAHARNGALELAFRHKVPCLMLDDDLVGFQWSDRTRGIPMSFPQAVVALLEMLDRTEYRLIAGNRITNPTWVRADYTENATVNGGILLIKETELRFDPDMKVSEDLDYALHHYDRYGGFLRGDAVLANFKHSQPGGVQEYRNSRVDNAAFGSLQRKWGARVKRRGESHALNLPTVKHDLVPAMMN